MLYIVLMKQDSNDAQKEKALNSQGDGEGGYSQASFSDNPSDALLNGDAAAKSHSRPGLLKSVSEHLDTLPLLPEQPDESTATSTWNIPEHFAFPQRWHLTRATRSMCAYVLVIAMTIIAVAGIILSIQTSVTTSWVCSAVSA